MSIDFPEKLERDLPPYLKRVAEKYDEQADACIRSYLTAMESVPSPPRLYHYTNAAGLAGILTSGTLWLSDIFTLNDPSELVYSMKVALELAKAQPQSPEMKLLTEQLGHFMSLDAAKFVASYFVCSLSVNGDDLYQWNMYADKAVGYALEFDTTLLEAAFTKCGEEPIINNSTFPLEYDRGRLEQLIGQMLALLVAKIAFVRRVMPADAGAYGAFMSGLVLTTALHLYRTSLFFKHPGYKHEGEYRFQALYGQNSPPAGVKVRAKGNMEVKYLELPWRALVPIALTGIRVGPAADFYSAKAAAIEALASVGLGSVPIEKSEIPYRP